MRILFIALLLALIAATFAVTAQDTQTFVEGVKKDINSILNVVDVERQKLNQEIKNLETGIKEKELDAAKAQFDAIAAEERLKQQQFIEKQITFMNGLINDPSTLEKNDVMIGKIPSRALVQARSCLDALTAKKNAYSGGLYFVTRNRKTLPTAPAVIKQMFCAEDGSTLVGAVNFMYKRKTEGTPLIPTNLQEKSKELNSDDLAQSKCQSFEECYFFLPKTTNNMEVVLTKLQESTQTELISSFKMKTVQPLRLQVMMKKLYTLLETPNLIIKDKGVKCSFHAAAALQICGAVDDQFTSESVKQSDIMRMYIQ